MVDLPNYNFGVSNGQPRPVVTPSINHDSKVLAPCFIQLIDVSLSPFGT